jgi:hypothetical protein
MVKISRIEQWHLAVKPWSEKLYISQSVVLLITISCVADHNSRISGYVKDVQPLRGWPNTTQEVCYHETSRDLCVNFLKLPFPWFSSGLV